MRTYTAHLRPGRAPVLVPEAFSWKALFFGPLWLLWHRAWLPALLAVVALVLACTLVPPPGRPAAAFAVLLVLALFGNDLRRWALERAGFVLGHVVAGRSRDEALFRLLSNVPGVRGALA